MYTLVLMPWQDEIVLFGMGPLPGPVVSLSPYVGRIQIFLKSSGLKFKFVKAA